MRNLKSDMAEIAPHFDHDYYLKRYPDVRAAGIDPLKHFASVGWREGRDPTAMANMAALLASFWPEEPPQNPYLSHIRGQEIDQTLTEVMRLSGPEFEAQPWAAAASLAYGRTHFGRENQKRIIAEVQLLEPEIGDPDTLRNVLRFPAEISVLIQISRTLRHISRARLVEQIEIGRVKFSQPEKTLALTLEHCGLDTPPVIQTGGACAVLNLNRLPKNKFWWILLDLLQGLHPQKLKIGEDAQQLLTDVQLMFLRDRLTCVSHTDG